MEMRVAPLTRFWYTSEIICSIKCQHVKFSATFHVNRLSQRVILRSTPE